MSNIVLEGDLDVMQDFYGRIKRGGACYHFRQLAPPLSHSLLQPLEEHAGRLKRDNSDLLYTGDTPNTSSWFSSQPKDDPLKLKAVQSL